MDKENKKVNTNLIIKCIIVIIIFLVVLGVIIGYRKNENIRNYIDYNVLNKQISDNQAKTIEIEDTNTYFCAYDRFIGILNNNSLKLYNSSAKKEKEINISITNPILKSNHSYLAIGEKKGKKIYVISGKNLLWQTDVDGEIINLNINRNGYVSIIVTQNTYKTVVITYDSKGNELFKRYLSDSYAIDTDISNNNNYLAIAQINTNGTQIQSNISIISMEKVERKEEDYIVYDKQAEANQMIVGIKYNNDNNLIAMFDNEIDIIIEQQQKKLIEFNKDTLFANIELNKSVVQVNQNNQEIGHAGSEVNIINTTNNSKETVKIEAIPKEIITNNNKVAINTGMNVYILNENGFLIKKFDSKQEIKQVILGENNATIVYNNKINIIKI